MRLPALEAVAAERCECGSPFPMHLAQFITGHVCLCERNYRVENGAFIADGECVNPFARHDGAVRERHPKKSKGGAQ